MKDRLIDFCGTADPLTFKLAGGRVKRYHAEGDWIQQTVDQHTWRLMVILLHFWPDISREAIVYALYHDVAERYTGDAPAPVKLIKDVAEVYSLMEVEVEAYLDIPDADTISAKDFARVKCADYLELCTTCASLFYTGAAAQRIFRKGVQLIQRYAVQLSLGEQLNMSEYITALEKEPSYV